VDDPAHLSELAETLSAIAAELPLFLPVHPGTRTRMEEQRIAPRRALDRFSRLPRFPLADVQQLRGPHRFRRHLRGNHSVGIPCLTLRDNTERPATIAEGTYILAGTWKSTILDAWNQMRRNPKAGRIP
jgi:UDP-N-acetylglucosamine 2-epimerase (non-hydrolysing)